ncbi:MAG: hypothetical protein ACREOM_00580 [Candidatus Dormibacteraceae bacterium]
MAALANEIDKAVQVAVQFMAEKNSRGTVITDLFQGAQQLVSDRWHMGLATALDEYRVSQAIAESMTVLPPAQPVGQFGAGSRALLSTIKPEQHDLGLRLAGLALADDGWDVHIVTGIEGGELPARASESGAHLVGISATYPTQSLRWQLSALIPVLHSLALPVIVGGAAFVRQPTLADQVDADATAADARCGVILARRLRLTHRHLWKSLSRP